MAKAWVKNWRVIPLPKGELNLGKTLQSGQQFTWKKIQGDGADTVWRGVLAKMVWTLKQDGNDGNLLYMIHGPHRNTKIASKRKRQDGTDLDRLHVSKKRDSRQGNVHKESRMDSGHL